MITIINISGMNWTIMLLESPLRPNGRPCANAGVINIAPPGGHFAARQRLEEWPIERAKSARTIAAVGPIATPRADPAPLAGVPLPR
jgi:hypothetical protein